MFAQIAVALLIAVVLGVLANWARQPLIIAFIAAGIVAGPGVLGVIDDPVEIELLAKVGISILLFLVGLKLDVRQIKVIGPVATATGLGQVLFTSAIGYVLARLLGLEPMAALYVAVALTFSSTIIIVKLLSDKGELQDLHGRIAIGFLIVQDIAVIVAMIGLTAIDSATGESALAQFAGVLGRGAILFVVLGIAMRWVLPWLVHRMARQAELLVLFAIAWAVGMATLTVVLGFNEEVGAFLAGVALASTPYREAIGGRLVPLRDFLLLFFFLDLGATLELGLAGSQIWAAILLSLFVLIGNPLIVMVIMGVMGYRKKVSFKAGLTVAQISEFSLILAALGFSLGYIDQATVGLITTVGMITIAISTYFITYSEQLYRWLEPVLGVFERERPATVPPSDERFLPEVVVVGLGRFGRELMHELRDEGIPVLGVDFDPVGVRSWQSDDIPVLYGEAEDPELPAAIPLERTRWVVSTLRNVDANIAVIQHLRHHGYRGAFATSAHTDEEATRLHAAGSNMVVNLFRTAAEPIIAAIVVADETRE
jgi:Kef-type K+ transport system membrane component KefB